MTQARFDGWVSVFDSGTDYEAEMARDRLTDSGIHAVIMAKKDSSFKLTHGALSRIYVLVAPQFEVQANTVLQSDAFTTEELTEIALSTDPEAVEPPPAGANGHGEAG